MKKQINLPKSSKDQIRKKAIRPNKKWQMILGAIFLPVIFIGFYIPWVGFSILACMVAGLLIALKRGRKWCDWWCPRGSFFDQYAIKISKQKDLPKWIYSYKFRLVFIGLLFSFLTFNIVRAWPNPAGVAFSFVKTLTITTIISLILAYFFRARSWCVLCPVGTFSGIIGTGKEPLFIDKKLCTSCTICSVVCPIGLEPYQNQEIGVLQSNDCIKCSTCVVNCPTKALKF